MELDSINEPEPIAVFPLSTVLFPGAILPLHIFEERYKAMVRYAMENGARFGLSYRKDADVGAETPPDIGSIGTIARIEALVPVEEGRMNLVSIGEIRYRLLKFDQVEPFLIAKVEPFIDDLEPDDASDRLFEDLTETCKKFLAAAQTLNELGAPITQELPDDPEAFSLLVSSALPIDNDRKQRLLEMTSTRLRLTRLRSYVTTALAEYDERLRIQERAKTNGHGRISRGS